MLKFSANPTDKKGMETRTHCKNGHKWTAETIYLYQGKRRCKVCKKRWKTENVETVRASTRQSHQKNRTKRQAYTRQWRKDNADRNRVHARTWRQRNPEKRNEISRRYRARKASAPVCDLTAEQWEAIKTQHNHKCVVCGSIDDITMDHIIPLSKGGSHTANNVTVLCRSCNSRKRDRDMPVPA